MTTVWGTINGYGTKNPTIHTGSGDFRVTRLGTGLYLIDFADGTFKEAPGMTITQQYSSSSSWTDFSSNGGNTRDNATIVALDHGQAKVKTGDADGNASDRNFSFIAIGN